MPGADDRPVAVVNPLGVGLHHYAEALRIAVSSLGPGVAELVAVEPSSRTDGSRLRWLKDYVQLLRSARRLRPARVIVTWPALGYWDFVLVRVLLPRQRTWIVLHDPRPLVYARGYGRLARRLASLSAMRSQVIVHSEAARTCVAEDASPRRLDVLPLPLKPAEGHSIAGAPADQPVIRVLGQYKADRDVAALERLAAEAPDDWTFEVVGRKWPEIPGWHVTSRFVSEEEFDGLIDTAHVILIPYRRFFQSDVAIRALEHATPVVGPRESSLAELLGSTSSWLVDDGSWLPAVSSAIAGGTEGAQAVAEAERARVASAWGAWIDA